MKYDISKCRRALEVEAITQTEVAERAGVSQSVVSNFFTGKPVRRTTVKRIVTALGLRMEEVIRRGRVA